MPLHDPGRASLRASRVPVPAQSEQLALPESHQTVLDQKRPSVNSDRSIIRPDNGSNS